MKPMKFAKVSEAAVTRAIVGGFAKEFSEYTESDCLIVGGGPSGLVAARDMARKGLRVLIVEQNNYLGGGMWVGGYLMNKVTFRSPSNRLAEELGAKLKEVSPGLFVCDGPDITSKLIAAACDAGVKFLQLTSADDVVLRNNRVEGLVINWTPVRALPRQITCVDPVALESKVVIDASGHDAVVAEKLASRGLIKLKGFGAMDMVASEDAVVEKTGEIYDGLILAGMSVATAHGLARMGPTFGSMLASGVRAAEIAALLIGSRAHVKREAVSVGD